MIADFSAWTVHYDLWCKMRFFRDMLHKDLEGEKASLQRGPVSLLALLPDEFTKQQVQELRIAEGMKPKPDSMLSQWCRRGQVEKDNVRGVYRKLTVNILTQCFILSNVSTIMARFNIITYGFGELAGEYYLDTGYRTAVRLFNRDLRCTRGLWDALQKQGYKEVTRAQVKAIVKYLGEP